MLLMMMMMMMMMAVMVSAFVELKCIGLGMKWSKSGVGQKPLARPRLNHDQHITANDYNQPDTNTNHDH